MYDLQFPENMRVWWEIAYFVVSYDWKKRRHDCLRMKGNTINDENLLKYQSVSYSNTTLKLSLKMCHHHPKKF